MAAIIYTYFFVHNVLTVYPRLTGSNYNMKYFGCIQYATVHHSNISYILSYKTMDEVYVEI
jgi:hypothetical protein